MTPKQKENSMKSADKFAETVAQIDDSEYRQWVGYLLEAIESEHIGTDREGNVSLRMIQGIINERLINERW